MRNKFGYVAFCLLLLSHPGYGAGIDAIFSALKKSQPDTNRIWLLLIAGETYEFHNYYEYNPGSLNNALKFFVKAKDLSVMLKNRKYLNESLCCIGDCNVLLGNRKEGKSEYLQVINFYRRSGDLNHEAACWERLADTMNPGDLGQSDEQLKMYRTALSLYNEVHNEKKVIELFQKIAIQHLNDGQLDLAEKELLQALAQCKTQNNLKLYPVYEKLARVYKTNGNLSKQLYYLLAMIRNFEAYGDKSEQDFYYLIMGGFYQDWGNSEEALRWDKKALESNSVYGDHIYHYEYLRNLIDVLLSQKRNRQALEYVHNAMSSYAPDDLDNKLLANESLANCALALGHLANAEKYYLQALAEYDILKLNRHTYSYYEEVRIHQEIGNYYFRVGNFKKSAFYLSQIQARQGNKVKPALLRNLYLTTFRTDSALNNFVAAIKNYQLYKKLSDSMFTIAKSGQIAEMETKYQSAQKERAIALLTSESKTERAELNSLTQEREITFTGIAMLLITGVIAYRAYQNKRRSNQQLKEQQNEIHLQNLSLRNLVEEKDILLNEKDWLLKEIHHRVKNNLQVVMGLLNAQSEFLKNREAITAIRESQNRVHSISLIHQKLYSTENASSVRMMSYINDLLLYLSDCYGTKNRKIRFEQIVDDIIIDISQAVPLGLIMNEAITNAIKYAFGPTGGEVIIAFKRIGNDNLMLMVTDNGKGISEEELQKENKSLGMKMMQILSKQLGAAYKLDGKSGVTITLEFPEEKTEHNIINKKYK